MTHTFPTSPTGNAASLHATQAKPLRREDSALLRGAGCFGQDVVVPNACHIAFVRSPQAHAQLLGIQTEAALQIDGVLAVLTSAELGQHKLPVHNPLLPVVPDTAFPLLAHDQVAYVGQPVAVVVATSRSGAESWLVDRIEKRIEESSSTISDSQRRRVCKTMPSVLTFISFTFLFD